MSGAEYYVVYNASATSSSNGTITCSTMSYSYPQGGWVAPQPSKPKVCGHCESGWHESEFHPGTCGNCGAPEGRAV